MFSPSVIGDCRIDKAMCYQEEKKKRERERGSTVEARVVSKTDIIMNHIMRLS